MAIRIWHLFFGHTPHYTVDYQSAIVSSHMRCECGFRYQNWEVTETGVRPEWYTRIGIMEGHLKGQDNPE